MIDIFEVLSWLIAIDGRSYLSDKARKLSRAARVTGSSDASVQKKIERLQELADRIGDNLEKAEIALHCAALSYWREWFSSAVHYARQAVPVYKTEKYDHRRAIARWILGMAEWKLVENHKAYANWDAARRLFIRQRRKFRDRPVERDWYDCALRLMNVDLASKPEEVFVALDRYEESSLTNASRQVVETAQRKIREKSFLEVDFLMKDLQKTNQKDFVRGERAEVVLERGLDAYQMGNLSQAIKLIEKALLQFDPQPGKNHKHMIARWMLGAMQWMAPQMEINATTEWRKCLEDLDALRIQSDKANRPARVRWYTDRYAILAEALSDKLPGSDTRRRKCTSFPYRAHGPTEVPNQSKLYSELVNLVRGDRSVADSLIEYERSRMPNRPTHELIQRAIERIRRDNQ